MDKNVISASCSTQNLTFRPGDPPAAFEVTVNNDSDRFANFQLEVLAAGENRNPAYRWYRLEPEVAAAKPPGSSTVFQVFILNTPIPGFVGTINLTINIFSPQLAQQRRLVLRLKIERDNSPTHLSVELPVREFQVYPRNTVDIPVRVRNLGQQPTDVVLRFTGVDPSWLLSSAERRLAVEPGGQAEVTFQCQPPSVVQAPSQNYLFAIEAVSNNSYPAKAEGSVEVLPVGFIDFTTKEKQQKIPSKNAWLPDWKADTGSFELLFKNASNLQQQIDVQVQGRDWRKCTFKKSPETANLNLGETTKVILDAKTKRPWIGVGKTLQFEAKSELSDQRLGSTDPATQTLELQALPIIPLWLQLAAIALLALLLAWLLQTEPIMHTRSVNSVGFSGIGLSVVSGSDDCTLRLWSIGDNNLQPERIKYDGQSVACGRQQNSKGLLAITNNPVRVSRFMPLENNRVAVGLDNGVIELRDVPSGRKIGELQDRQDPNAIGDRVFDLVFTSNSLYLFSSYGSGKVRVWSRLSPNRDFLPEATSVDVQRELKLSGFEARALALSSDAKTLVVAGNYKRFILLQWDATQSKKQFQSLSEQKLEKFDERVGRQDYVWGLAFVPNSPEKILATSDSAGFITIWNLNQCQTIKNSNPQERVNELNCSHIDRWQASKTSVRTLAFSEDGRLLVSGGDDGRVIVWDLTVEHKLDKTKAAEGTKIYESPKKINSIDLKEINQQKLIVSGSEDSQVKLHSIK
jgi:WD40 repeat protein